MNRHLLQYILICIGSLLLFSCTKEVNADLEDLSGRPVLNGLLRADTTLSVHLTRSKPVLGPGAQAAFDVIPDAQVWVYENGVHKVLSYNSQSNRYESSWNAVPGRTYRIQAQIPGMDAPVSSGEEFMPQPVALKSLSADSFIADGSQYLLVDFRFDDPPQPGDFYHAVLYKRCYMNGQVSFQDYADISYDLDNPLGSGNNANASSYANVRYQDIGYYHGVAFSDADRNGKEIRFTFPVNHSINGCEPGQGELYLELRKCSKAYYEYINSVSQYQGSAGNPFGNPVQVYDNINNGSGIWGAYSLNTKTFGL